MALALTSCVSLGREEPPQEYYVLGGTPPQAVAEVASEAADVAVGLRRPRVAAYLASHSLVVRTGPNQVDFTEFRRWGEPLGDGVNRVVARDLSARGIHEVAVAPWAVRRRLDYLVQLDVERFEGLAPVNTAAGPPGVHLRVAWEILRAADGVALAQGTTDYRSPGWKIGDYPELVRGLDTGLGILAADLTAAVAKLVGPPAG